MNKKIFGFLLLLISLMPVVGIPYFYLLFSYSLFLKNRIFVKYGCLVIKKGRRLGLSKLLKFKNIDLSSVTSETIGYQIAPRINAASRMDHANTAYELLITKDKKEAVRRICEELG